MFRSLHIKLVLIMLLLILSLMAVVGSFLINSVSGFYLERFYEQMRDAFDDADLAHDLRSAAAAPDAEERLGEILQANAGPLGIDSASRNYYILDGKTGKVLRGSDKTGGTELGITPNISIALTGEDGYQSDVTAGYMDVALPLSGEGGKSYVIYIRDTGETVQDLNSELFLIIVEALVFGLAISVLLSFILAKTMITPIERLTDGAERVASGDFSHRIEVASKDEIGVLTNTFNHMARVLEKTLEEAENERNKLDTLFLHMTDGVTAFDRDGKIIHSNPAAEQMLGRTLEPGSDYQTIFGDIAPLEEVLSLQYPDAVKAERTEGGRSLALLFAPFRSETQGGIMAVIHDVTEQKRTEEIRREFVANVSHELRTPLTNIRSYAETLADGEDIPPAIRKDFFGVILNETDRMTHIVQDLLTLSRFDSGRIDLNYSRFSFARAVTDVYNAVLLEANRRGHKVTLQLDPELPEIHADRDRISQVIMNVVSNSIKYTPDGGLIEISAGRTENELWLEVADNGIGIPPEDRSRIFERFYRVDKARSRESGGTGLGLSIAKQIMLLHKGDIVLLDRDGPGITVRVTLPIKENEDA